MQLQLTQESTDTEDARLKIQSIFTINHPTATIWVSNGRYTYETTDGKHNGHCGESSEIYFSKALKLQTNLLATLGYLVIIENTVIEG